MHEMFVCISPLIYMAAQGHSVDLLFNGWLAELPTMLDSFHQLINAINGSSMSKFFNGQMTSIEATVLKSTVANCKSISSLTSKLCGDSLLTVYLVRQDEAI